MCLPVCSPQRSAEFLGDVPELPCIHLYSYCFLLSYCWVEALLSRSVHLISFQTTLSVTFKVKSFCGRHQNTCSHDNHFQLLSLSLRYLTSISASCIFIPSVLLQPPPPPVPQAPVQE